jgi:Asp-tRNA(Asn)/Glu-tRNA(Gln) amidotransferase A subunit family amidase
MATATRSALNELTASAAARAIAAREITAEALTRACLDRIAERDGTLRAWTHVDPARALAEARERDRSPSRAPLHGVPVGVKDVIDVADTPTEYGSVLYRGHMPTADSACVAAARASGAVILGKTATTEFASPWPAGVRNPHDISRTPGVSSSGSAAAVADMMVPLAFGTQTGGSTIRPASYCGLWGFKASLDGLPRAGIRHLKPGIDTLGLFARSLADIALFRAGLTGDASSIASPAAPPRIGVCGTPHWSQALPETVAAIETTAERCSAAGAKVSDVALPDGFDGVMAAFRVLSSVENRRSFAAELAHGEVSFNPWIRDSLAASRTTTDTEYTAANAEGAAYRARYARLFESYDLLLTPSADGKAPSVAAPMTAPGAFNAFWTWMYGPALNVPAFTGPMGLPVGIQLVGREGADARLLSWAAWVEKALGKLPIAVD